MGDRPLVHDFVEFAMEAFSKGLPTDVEHAARRQLIDSVGVAIAAHLDPTVSTVRGVAEAAGGVGVSRSIGSAGTSPTCQAAFVGGTLAHALDFDDTHGPSVLHPSASVVPTALAVAAEHGSSLDEILRAITVGNELVVRLGMAGVDETGQDSIFFERGFHATSICGTIGSALAASLLSGADHEQIVNTLSIASSFSSGLLEANRTGGTIKRVHCGWAAFSAVTARDLASAGLTGAPTFLEGRFGLLHAFCGPKANHDWLKVGLGDDWEILRIGFKPYPTNGFVTSVVDAAIGLRDRGLRLEDIRAAAIALPAPVLRTVAQPRQQKIRPSTPYGARFSAPFVFALAIKGGGGLGLALEDFSEATIHDESLLSLAERVIVESDDAFSSAFPGDVPTRVEVELVAGGLIVEEVAHRRGGMNRPLSDEELFRKFQANASIHLEDSLVDEIYRMMATGPGAVSASDLIQKMVIEPKSVDT